MNVNSTLYPFKDENLADWSQDAYINHIDSVLSYLNYKKKLSHKKIKFWLIAAGNGRRLNFDGPKILYNLRYPCGKQSILANHALLINSLQDFIPDLPPIGLVVNERFDVKRHSGDLQKSNFEIIQLSDKYLKGTAATISAIRKFSEYSDINVFIWGDLALWNINKVLMNLGIHIGLKLEFSFITKIKENPYVAFIRSKDNKIRRVQHANEGVRYTGYSEQDCSIFIANRDIITTRLSEFINANVDKLEEGLDFVHFIPYLYLLNAQVAALPIGKTSEFSGINTVENAVHLESFLSGMTNAAYKKTFLARND